MTEQAGDTGGTLTGPALGSAGTPPAGGPLLPGDPRQIGGYRVLGRLGEGGMGVVFLAAAPGGATVAVKVIRADFARDEGFRARFRAETDAARRVARFCTAQVLDAGIHDGPNGESAYLVTEFIDGPPLSAAVARDGPLRGSMLDSLAIGVAAALNGIHGAGVVHRDLKPGNVLLSRVGPKVIDFGIARALDGPDPVTEPGQVIGTPAYMAPERFAGRATRATDIFAWGAVVTFAGTGRAPFGSGEPYELMHRVTHGQPDLTGLEPPLRDLIARALSKRPEDRPAARALLLELVGDADDPVGATTRVLGAGWAPPPGGPGGPGGGTRPPAPTRVDNAPGRGRTGRRVRILTAVTIAAAALVAALLFVNRELPGLGARPDDSPPASSAPADRSQPGGVPPDADGSTGQSEPAPDRRSERVPGDGAATSIGLNERVPRSGVAELGIGEVHRFRVRVTTDVEAHLVGEEACAHLLPWRLTGPGGVVSGAELSCSGFGPVPLAPGQYELTVGGPDVGGQYAFRLVATVIPT